MSKIYVLDTNVLISNPYALYAFTKPGTQVIVTSATLGELDHLKTKESTSRDARLTSRLLSKVLDKHTYADIQAGISLSETNPALDPSIKFRIADYKGDKLFGLGEQDNKIIATCKQENAMLITRDINMFVIALSGGCEAELYTGDDTIKDSDVLYPGYIKCLDFWDRVNVNGYDGEIALISYDSDYFHNLNFYPGQYLYDIGNGEDGEVVGRVVAAREYHLEVLPIKQKAVMSRKLMKSVTPRDIFQGMAFDAMVSHDVDIVSLLGAAGSGKTMIAVAAALDQIHKGKYANMMYIKADSDLGKEIGFLPGTLGEKLRPSVEPCYTSMKIIFKDLPEPEKKIEELVESGVALFPSLSFFRGMSIGHPDPGKGTVLIVDECQNLSNHEMRSIISRCGENTLLILCGNIKQIDNPRNTAVNNGFVYAVEKLKEYEHARHVILKHVYRSRLAAFVEDNF